MLCKNWTAPQPNERGTSGKWKWKPDAQHPSLHWMCLYIIIFCSLFFCIFKVEHNTCVTPDTEQPGCGKHFPLKFFLAKRYVRDTLLLSLHFFLYFSLSFCFLSPSVSLSLLLPSLSCGIYQIFVIFNVAFFSLRYLLNLNFFKYSILWKSKCILSDFFLVHHEKFAPWNLVCYRTNNFLGKLFRQIFWCRFCHYSRYGSHFKVERFV